MKKIVDKNKYQLVWDTDTKQIKAYDTNIGVVYVPSICTHFEGTKDECDAKISELDLIMPE